MNAIVYTSNSGFTKQYAELLSKQTDLPQFSLKEAETKISNGDEIIYLGWLMASKIEGFKKAQKRYKILAVCSVGMSDSATQRKEIIETNSIPDGMQLFTLQGGFDMNKLHGIYKFMMSFMKLTVGKTLRNKQDKTAEEKDMLDLLDNGGNRVSDKNLENIVSWYRKTENILNQ